MQVKDSYLVSVCFNLYMTKAAFIISVLSSLYHWITLICTYLSLVPLLRQTKHEVRDTCTI